MSLLDRYHVFVHNVSATFGYDYNDATPDWVHPFIHIIFVLTPTLLISVGSYLVLRGLGPWKSKGQAEWETLQWVDWFNKERLLEPLGYITPIEAEEKYEQAWKSDEIAA